MRAGCFENITGTLYTLPIYKPGNAMKKAYCRFRLQTNGSELLEVVCFGDEAAKANALLLMLGANVSVAGKRDKDSSARVLADAVFLVTPENGKTVVCEVPRLKEEQEKVAQYNDQMRRRYGLVKVECLETGRKRWAKASEAVKYKGRMLGALDFLMDYFGEETICRELKEITGGSYSDIEAKDFNAWRDNKVLEAEAVLGYKIRIKE